MSNTYDRPTNRPKLNRERILRLAEEMEDVPPLSAEQAQQWARFLIPMRRV